MVSPCGGLFYPPYLPDCNSGSYYLLLQGEENPKRGSKKPKGRECKLCKAKLPPGYSKLSCKVCIAQVLEEETPSLVSSLRDVIKEEISNSLKNLQPEPSSSGQKKPSVQNSSGSEDEGPSQLEAIDLDSLPSSDEEPEVDSVFQGEDIEPLLKAIRATLEIEDPKVERSTEDRIFEGLGSRRKRTFPIHRSIKDLIQREWKYPDRKVYFPRSNKRKYPFEEGETSSWDRAPKLDGALTKMMKRTSLPIEDAGSLQDPMDRRVDTCLRRSWEASTAALKPDVASACVARTLIVWLGQLEEHVRGGTPREAILSSLPMLKKAAAFLADASSDSIKMTAKAAALSNSARRALWLRGWRGDVSSKSRLCSIPCDGGFLFGSVLDDLLEKASDKGKLFPATFPNRQYLFRGSGRQPQFRKRRLDTTKNKDPKRSRGFMFSQSSGSSHRPRK